MPIVKKRPGTKAAKKVAKYHLEQKARTKHIGSVAISDPLSRSQLKRAKHAIKKVKKKQLQEHVERVTLKAQPKPAPKRPNKEEKKAFIKKGINT